jgi:hypothetical protein
MEADSSTGKWEVVFSRVGEPRCVVETQHYCAERERHNQGKEFWFLQGSSWQDCIHCGESPPIEIRTAIALLRMGK